MVIHFRFWLHATNPFFHLLQEILTIFVHTIKYLIIILFQEFVNYHCSGWASLSSILSLILLALHIWVKRDISYANEPRTFTTFIRLGDLGAILGLGAFVGYLVKGIVVKERGE